MKNNISILICILFSFINLNGQGWVNVIDYANLTTNNTIKTNDGNYLTTLNALHGIGSSDPGKYLLKFDIDGNTISLNKVIDGQVFVLESPDDSYFLYSRFSLAQDAPFISKLNAGFEEIMTSNIIFNSQATNTIGIPIITSDNHLLVAGSDGTNGYFRKYDLNLNLIWETSGHPSGITSMVENDLGEIIYVFGGLNSNSGSGVGKINAVGTEIWTSDLTSSLDFAFHQLHLIPDGSIMLFSAYAPSIPPKQIRISSTGELEWIKELIEPGVFIVTSKQVQVSDGFVTTGAIGSQFPGEGENLLLLKTDFDGNVVWDKRHHIKGKGEYCRDIVMTPDGGFIGATEYSNLPTGISGVYLFRANSDGNIYNQQLQGNIRFDDSENCLMDNAVGMERWTISASNDEHTIYGSTDELGSYTLNVPVGIYTITVHPPNELWNVCENDLTVGFVENAQLTRDFVITAEENCPLLAIQSALPTARPCFDNNTYYLSYCNEGTITATNGFVDIRVGEGVSYVSSSIPLSSQSGSTYTFSIGDFAPGTCGSFNVNFMLDCDFEIGEAVCLTSEIWADMPCIGPNDVPWFGPEVLVDANCVSDSIVFSLTNIGPVDMSTSREFIVIEDAIVLKQGDYQLNAQDIIYERFDGNGGTHILETTQVPGAPGEEVISVWVEGCGTNQNGAISTGFVNQYSLGDNNPKRDRECREASSAFDPNDKQGVPRGYSEEHFITKNIKIEYLVRFQNTGNDTAFTVVLLDTIAPELDLGTLRVGPASHDFDWEITDGNVLAFTFNSILLPDSTTNFDASNGFVKFTIQQQPNLEDGTVIRNDVGIYFDFNEVVMTNEAFHTIREDYIILSDQTPFVEAARITVYPNPFNEFTTFKMNEYFTNSGFFELFDLSGKSVRQQSFTGNEFIFQRDNLPNGNYFYKITDTKNGKINSGQLSIQ